MKLSDYQWSHNPRGMHNQGVMPLAKLQEQKNWALPRLLPWMWAMLIFQGVLLSHNITPVIRIYRPQFSGVPMDGALQSQFQQYLNVGVKWFEFYNEPNLGLEWPNGRNFDPLNTSGVDCLLFAIIG